MTRPLVLPLRSSGSDVYPSIFHCRVCGARFRSTLDIAYAVCRPCWDEESVVDHVRRFGIPQQMEYPSLSRDTRLYDPALRTKGHGRAQPCQLCGAASRGEGNSRRYCLNGHLT